MEKKAAIIIPARMSSTRFPNKPMALIYGKTMIERVWNLGIAADIADVFIATDDLSLESFAKQFGANVIMTQSSCLTGTDRVAEVANKFLEYDIFFSLQGDAVLTPPWVIRSVLQTMLENSDVQMATAAVRLEGKALSDFVLSKKAGSSGGTCVTFDTRGNALYFSKSLIPYTREAQSPIYRHIGLYAYQRSTLLKLQKTPEGVFEKAEKLEQLRALENGIPIRVVIVDYQGRTHGSVDLPEDVALVEKIIHQEGELI
jgi:3-deoxy-manno-octulosonate cytidylyltransferase (CMP-KDO synthetase)